MTLPLFFLLLFTSCSAVSILDYFSTKRSYPNAGAGEESWVVVEDVNGENVVYHEEAFFFDSDTDRPGQIAYQSKETVPLTCSLVQAQLVSRHGTRNPTSQKVRDYVLLENFIGRQQGPLLDSFLTEWRSPFSQDDAGLLFKPQGVLDMKDLSIRSLKRYNQLLKIATQPISVQATKKDRAIDSARAFLSPILGKEVADQYPIRIDPKDSDLDLTPWKTCKAYQKLHESLRRQSDTYEYKKWMEKFMPALIKSVSFKTRLQNLTAAHVLAMYELCAFQNAINHTTSDGFCDYFSLEDLDDLEFMEDLEFQEFWGYSHPIHTSMTCSLFSSVYRDMIKTPNRREFILKFAHAETLIPAITALRLFDDGDNLRGRLNASMPPSQRNKREWVVSKIAPFAANIWFELYECDGEPFVRVLHNERVVKVGSCPSNLCSLKDFVKSMGGDEILNCDFFKVCSI